MIPHIFETFYKMKPLAILLWKTSKKNAKKYPWNDRVIEPDPGILILSLCSRETIPAESLRSIALVQKFEIFSDLRFNTSLTSKRMWQKYTSIINLACCYFIVVFCAVLWSTAIFSIALLGSIRSDWKPWFTHLISWTIGVANVKYKNGTHSSSFHVSLHADPHFLFTCLSSTLKVFHKIST